MSERDDHESQQSGKNKRVYRLRIDKELFETDERYLSGAAILGLAGLDPAALILIQAKEGGVRTEIAPTQTVDLGDPGLERFFTMKNEHTNGLGTGHREFDLLPEDEACLASTGLTWEAREINQERWIFLRDYPLPDGLEPRVADLGVRLSANYPMTEIDMVYFHPPLRHHQNRDIPNLAMVTVGNRSWQQWSRHRPPNSWRPNVDRLETHLAFVAHVLSRAGSQ